MCDSERVCLCQGLDISVSCQGLSACSGKSCSRILPLNPCHGAFLSEQVAERNPVVCSRKCLITCAPWAATARQGLRRFCCLWLGSALGILWHSAVFHAGSILGSSLASAAEATGTAGPRPGVSLSPALWIRSWEAADQPAGHKWDYRALRVQSIFRIELLAHCRAVRLLWPC